jgi:rhomboid protease GluP
MLDVRRFPATALLLASIFIGFAFQWLSDGSLTEWGANFGPYVRNGQYWRLVTSMFLHGNLLHLIVNAWGLYQLGELFELLLGSGRLLLVYFLSGIAGSVASVLFTEAPSVGASGAIFGLMGALIAFLLRRRENLTAPAKSLLGQLVVWAGINIAFGASTPTIDNAAHLGGCAAGLVLGLILQPRYLPHAPLPPAV